MPEAAAVAAEAVAPAVALAADAAELAPAAKAVAAALEVTVAIARASSARKLASDVPVEAAACLRKRRCIGHAPPILCTVHGCADPGRQTMQQQVYCLPAVTESTIVYRVPAKHGFATHRSGGGGGHIADSRGAGGCCGPSACASSSRGRSRGITCTPPTPLGMRRCTRLFCRPSAVCSCVGSHAKEMLVQAAHLRLLWHRRQRGQRLRCCWP